MPKHFTVEEANALLRKHHAQGFKAVFNGRDFTGWDGPVDQYEVKDGAIVCRPKKGGNIYTAAAATCSNTSANRGVRTYYASNVPGGANTLTVNMTGTANYVEIYAQEYAGIIASAPVDAAACNAGATTALTVGPVTTTNATEAPIKATPPRIQGCCPTPLVRRRTELGPEVRVRRGLDGAEMGCPTMR